MFVAQVVVDVLMGASGRAHAEALTSRKPTGNSRSALGSEV
jgi:hypothetical protein